MVVDSTVVVGAKMLVTDVTCSVTDCDEVGLDMLNVVGAVTCVVGCSMVVGCWDCVGATDTVMLPPMVCDAVALICITDA